MLLKALQEKFTNVEILAAISNWPYLTTIELIYRQEKFIKRAYLKVNQEDYKNNYQSIFDKVAQALETP